jgi:hypothetical protein
MAYGSLRPGASGTPIAIGTGQHLTNIRLTLTRGGLITGTVRNSDGRPAASITVSLTPAGSLGGFRDVVTDAHGAFRIDGLPEADYVLMARLLTTSAPTYLPGVADPREATSIHVAPGDERAVELTLAHAKRVRVSGIVLGPDGLPYSGARLWMRQPGWDPYGPRLELAPGADGRFVFIGAIPGPHTIQATGRAPHLSAVEDLNIGVEDVSDIALRLQPLTQVSGRVRFEGTSLPAPPDLTGVRVFLERAGFQPGEATVGSDGTFMHALAPGTYQLGGVAPEGFAGWRLQSAIVRGQDLLDSPFEIAWGTSDITGIVLTFSDRHTALSGTVLAADNVPTSACSIVAFPADPALWNALSRRLSATRPATNGRFAFADLPPGEYVVAAVRDLQEDRWRTPAQLETLVRQGIRISLAAGDTKQQNLRLGERDRP